MHRLSIRGDELAANVRRVRPRVCVRAKHVRNYRRVEALVLKLAGQDIVPHRAGSGLSDDSADLSEEQHCSSGDSDVCSDALTGKYMQT